MNDFDRIPQPMTVAAQARPRDPSGRVTMPIRAEAKMRGTGFRRYFRSWPEVADWLASDEFAAAAPRIKALTIVRQDPSLGPDIVDPPAWRDPRREV